MCVLGVKMCQLKFIWLYKDLNWFFLMTLKIKSNINFRNETMRSKCRARDNLNIKKYYRNKCIYVNDRKLIQWPLKRNIIIFLFNSLFYLSNIPVRVKLFYNFRFDPNAHNLDISHYNVNLSFTSFYHFQHKTAYI